MLQHCYAKDGRCQVLPEPLPEPDAAGFKGRRKYPFIPALPILINPIKRSDIYSEHIIVILFINSVDQGTLNRCA